MFPYLELNGIGFKMGSMILFRNFFIKLLFCFFFLDFKTVANRLGRLTAHSPPPNCSEQASHYAAFTVSLWVLLTEQVLITSFYALAGFLAQWDVSAAKFCFEGFMGLSLHAP